MTTETPIEIEPRDWQDILGYIRALEERVMRHACQIANLESRVARDEINRAFADLKAEGYIPRRPGGEAERIDRLVCAEASCAACGHRGLGYEPWTRKGERLGERSSYRSFAVCPNCSHREEM